MTAFSELLDAIERICEREPNRNPIHPPLVFENELGQLFHFRQGGNEAVVFVGTQPTADRFAFALRPGESAERIVEVAEKLVDQLDPFGGELFSELNRMLDEAAQGEICDSE